MRASKSRGSNRRLVVRLVVACAVLSAASSAAVYWLVNINSVYLVQEFRADTYVDNIVGLNADNDAIHFGIVAPGGEGQRKLIVYTQEHRTQVSVESSGPIAEWISVSENNFIMEPYSSKTIWVVANVPEDTTIPNFRNGTVRVTFRRLLF